MKENEATCSTSQPEQHTHTAACTGHDHAEPAGQHSHDHDHGHGHGHHHHHHLHGGDMEHLNKAFKLGIVLNIVYVIVELVAGIWLSSVSLISDAGHNLSDVVSLVLALLAFKLAQVRPSQRYTYGYKKSTVLVSLLNACILLVAVGIIIWESVEKLRNPHPVEGGAIAWVAGVGIVVNALTAWLFMKDRKRDLNVKGAFLHMAADALVSLGVVVSGLIISATGWYLIDPIIGIIIAVVILISTIQLLFDSVRLSLDGVPANVPEPDKVRGEVLAHEPRVADMHHIHIWAMSTTENALTAHLVVERGTDEEAVKGAVKHLLEEMGISHATLEFEHPDCCCASGSCC